MVIKYKETFDKMKPANYDGFFDWDFLLPAFKGTKIEPMDIDGVVERRGNILMFETKNIGIDIPLGQKITLETFIKLGKGKITIFVLYGKSADTIKGMEEWNYCKGKIIKNTIECDMSYVLLMVESWFKLVNKK